MNGFVKVCLKQIEKSFVDIIGNYCQWASRYINVCMPVWYWDTEHIHLTKLLVIWHLTLTFCAHLFLIIPLFFISSFHMFPKCVFLFSYQNKHFTLVSFRLTPGYLCHECPHGWLKFQEQCFYLSTTRLNWTLSQMNCSDSGGSLAVIDSREVQVAATL